MPRSMASEKLSAKSSTSKPLQCSAIPPIVHSILPSESRTIASAIASRQSAEETRILKSYQHMLHPDVTNQNLKTSSGNDHANCTNAATSECFKNRVNVTPGVIQ